jgi:hypothetical protein
MKRVICGSYKPRRRERRVPSACAGGHIVYVVYVTESTQQIRGHRGSTAVESAVVEGCCCFWVSVGACVIGDACLPSDWRAVRRIQSFTL